jgi:hypothetical protein
MRVPWTVLPGGLSADDHNRIRSLAERGWKSPRIAREIQKHPGTVYWFMLRDGLVERRADARILAEPYRRGDRMVYPYTGEEDAYIQALRVQNIGFSKIADLATKRFGKPRSAHSVEVRLTILAANV